MQGMQASENWMCTFCVKKWNKIHYHRGVDAILVYLSDSLPGPDWKQSQSPKDLTLLWWLWRTIAGHWNTTFQVELKRGMSRLTIKKGGPLLPAVTKQMLKFWHILAIKGCQSSSHWHLSHRNLRNNKKHCQRHNGPEGWVHITRSQFTNLDHITISESRLSINFKISTKHKNLD